jgi:hypothetical protein
MITRFGGLRVPGWAGPLPGGGSEGATPALDAAVHAHAQWLEGQFGLPVQIRFNANRWSGGAWIMDPGRGDCGLGLTVSQTPERDPIRDETGSPPQASRPADPSPLRDTVYVAADLLPDTDRGTNTPDASYGLWLVDSPEAARALAVAKIGPVYTPREVRLTTRKGCRP